MLRGKVAVIETMTRHGRKPYPKGRARREVPLEELVGDRVAAMLARRGAGRDDLVFVGPRGGVLSDSNVRDRIWLPAVAAAEVPGGPTLHDLRHTYASWLVQAGVKIPRVQLLLGHKSITTTMRYAHLAPDDDDAEVLGALRVGARLAQRSNGTR